MKMYYLALIEQVMMMNRVYLRSNHISCIVNIRYTQFQINIVFY